MIVNSEADAFFVRTRRIADASLRLFCFPYAGGGASIFREWVDRLPEEVELVAVQYPGRETRFREVAFRRLRPLVAALEAAIQGLLDRPFAFFGHSMGALIAFELARSLQAKFGRSPRQFFASCRGAPHLPNRDAAIHMLPDAEFIDQLRRLNGTPAVVLEHSELLQLLVPTLRADFATCETYEFSPAPPLNCAITAIGGLGDEHVTRDDLIGWGQHTSSSFQLRMLPGDHFLLRSQQPLLLQLLKDAFAPSSKPAVREFSETHVDRPWPPAPKTLRLNTGDVHLWRARLDLGPSCIRRLRSLLSPDEMSRADRFRSAVDSNRFIAGRAQLREILAQCIQCEPTSLRFEYGPQGKPSLVGMTREPLQFNLAHSRGLALIAVCQGSEVGVDVEYTARDLDCDELARQVFSPGELTQFERVSVISDRKSMFFKCWTRKEAFLKAIGVGLSRAPCHIDAMLDADNWYQMECDPAGTAEPQIWTIRDLQPEADYAGAVAIRRPPANLQQWTWIQSLVAASPAVS